VIDSAKYNQIQARANLIFWSRPTWPNFDRNRLD